MTALTTELQGLLGRISEAFESSDVKHLAQNDSVRWNYSLVTGACQLQAPLIVGFNWGASAGHDYDPQRVLEPSQWNRDDLGSFVRVLPYMKRYLPSIPVEAVTQTNYCFFRSKEEKQISARDLELCRPLFVQLLAIMQPAIVLSFSSRLRAYMLRTNQIKEVETAEFKQQSGKRTVGCVAVTGKLDTGTPIAFLPHPNYPLQRAVRESIWEFCAKQLQQQRVKKNSVMPT